MNKKGFTLVEIVLGLAIIGVISIAMLTVISNNFTFMNRSKEMSQETFQSQQTIELEITSIKNELTKVDHGLTLDTVTIDGVDVVYHSVDKMYHNYNFQYMVTPEQLPEYVLLKTFDVKATLKTDTYNADAIYPIVSSSIKGSNNPDASTYSTYWMRDIKQWYVSNPGYNTPVPRGDTTDLNFKHYDFIVNENLDSELGTVYPLFPEDYILIGTETDDLIDDVSLYAGRHIVYQVTPAAKSGKLGISEVSEPVYISGLTNTNGLEVHLDASYIDESNSLQVASDDKVLTWKDISSGIEASGITDTATSSNASLRPTLEKTDLINDFPGKYVAYSGSLNSVINGQNTNGKHVYVYAVARGSQGYKVISNGSRSIFRSASDEKLINDWYFIKDSYTSSSNNFVVGESDIDVSEVLVYAFTDPLNASEESTLYTSVSNYFKSKFKLENEIGEIQSIDPLTKELYVDDLYAPPSSALAKMSTGEYRDVEITWLDDGPIDTSVAATVIRNGFATSTPSKTVQLTVTVKPYAIEVLSAKFISESIIEVDFGKNIDEEVDLEKIKIDGINTRITYKERAGYDKNKLLLFLNTSSIDYFKTSTNNTILFEKDSVKFGGETIEKIEVSEGTLISELPDLIFSDDFETFENWEMYRSGNVESFIDPKDSDNKIIAKIDNDDSDGGFKRISYDINQNYIFEGWLYRPNDYSGGAQDRLAISKVSNNGKKSDGYGFGISGSNIYIEKRSGTSTQSISDNVSYARANNEWYKFIFKGNTDHSYELYIFDENGDYQVKVSTDGSDSSFDVFDAVVIHGGHDFFADDFKLFTY